MRKRVLIVGGVAGGASCAARLRRLDEEAEIVLFDRGPYVSFANCGLPYFVGNVIADEQKLLVASSTLFRERFEIAVQTRHEVIAIDRARRSIRVRDLDALGGPAEREEHYDALVLAPGAAPIRPPLPGIDLPGIFAVRTIPDSRRIRTWITSASRDARWSSVAASSGSRWRKISCIAASQTTVLEKLPQVMPPLDPEIAYAVAEHLRERAWSCGSAMGSRASNPEAATSSWPSPSPALGSRPTS